MEKIKENTDVLDYDNSKLYDYRLITILDYKHKEETFKIPLKMKIKLHKTKKLCFAKAFVWSSGLMRWNSICDLTWEDMNLYFTPFGESLTSIQPSIDGCAETLTNISRKILEC